MEIQNHLLNKKGQVLIESLFLVFLLASVLIVFSKLMEFQKNKKFYNFNELSKTNIGRVYVQ